MNFLEIVINSIEFMLLGRDRRQLKHFFAFPTLQMLKNCLSLNVAIKVLKMPTHNYLVIIHVVKRDTVKGVKNVVKRDTVKGVKNVV